MTLCHLPLSILPNFRPPFDFIPNNEILSNKNTYKILSYNKLVNKKRKQNEDNLERKTPKNE